MVRGFRPYFESAKDYMEFLEGTLIPDLEEDGQRQMANDFKEAIFWMGDRFGAGWAGGRKSKPRKKSKSKKVKILDEMAKKKWATYKKGKGKKTYIQIRAEVSRSQKYKRKVKNL